MDQELDDGRFWLPPDFLDEDDLFLNFNSGKNNSDFSSPVESVTESDEEDYLNEMSRNLAQFTLEDNFQKTESDSANFAFENRHSKSMKVMAGSPQSTLCGYNQLSSRGSSKCPSPSPAPAPALRHVEPLFDVLCAAAGEVVKLKMAQEAGFKIRQPPRTIPSPNPQFNQIQTAQLKKQQIMKQQLLLQQQQQYQQLLQQSRVRNAGGNIPPATLSGSGMRAVYLGNPNINRKSTGTGVFLPRQTGAPIETNKKRGCSTVLLPDRVVHALNLNLETQTRSNVGLPRHDYKKIDLMAEQRRQQAERDLRLPPEWTY